MRWSLVALLAACGTAAPPVVPSSSGPSSADDGDVIQTVAAGRITYVYRASRMTNLLYELDCLAGLHVCSRDAFVADWHAGWTADDDVAIAAWQKLRRHYHGMIEDGTLDGIETPLPVAYHSRSVAHAIRLTGYGTRDVDDYLARFAVFASAADVGAARGLVAQFAARATQRWTKERPRLVAALADYTMLQQRADVRALVESIAEFYKLEHGGLHQTFDLIARPLHRSSSSAEQLGELGIIEVSANESARNAFPVITHEMFHSWFQSSPIAAQVALVKRFASSGDPLALPAYGLLDETLASALGNGLVQRAVDRAEYDDRVAVSRGFYDEPLVDAASKALLPVLETRLAAGKTLFDDDFVPEYLGAIHAAFPTGLPPIAYLRPMACAIDPALQTAQSYLMEKSHAGYIECSNEPGESADLLAQHPAWGAAIVWKRDDLGSLAPLVDRPTLAALHEQAKTEHDFVLTQRHSPLGVLFVFIVKDDASAQKLIDAFANQPGITALRDGVYVP